MNEQEYIESRLEDQVKYYEKNSLENKKYYYYFKTSEISISVVIPFLTGYIMDNPFIKYVIGGLSVMLALLTGLEVLYKFQDKWITYRATAETLIQEKYMFLSKAGSYKDDQTLSNLSERVELILAKENSTWNQIMSKDKTQNTADEKTQNTANSITQNTANDITQNTANDITQNTANDISQNAGND